MSVRTNIRFTARPPTSTNKGSCEGRQTHRNGNQEGREGHEDLDLSISLETFETWHGPGIHPGSSGLCLSHPQLVKDSGGPSSQVLNQVWLVDTGFHRSSIQNGTTCVLIPSEGATIPTILLNQGLVDGSQIEYFSDEFNELCTQVGATPVPASNPLGAGGKQNLDGHGSLRIPYNCQHVGWVR